MALSDEELIREYLRGEEVAFTRLLERHLKTVYSFTLRFVGDKAEAEDIVQDTFLKAWKNLKRYDPQVAKFKTWLMRIARNTAVDYLRKKKPLSFSNFEDDGSENLLLQVPDTEPLPEELFAHVQDVHALEAALQQISPNQREVILLHDMNGLTFEEIAEALEEPLNTLKSRYRRGIVGLRQHFFAMHQKPE